MLGVTPSSIRNLSGMNFLGSLYTGECQSTWERWAIISVLLGMKYWNEHFELLLLHFESINFDEFWATTTEM